jgi:hypothetical protein
VVHVYRKQSAEATVQALIQLYSCIYFLRLAAFIFFLKKTNVWANLALISRDPGPGVPPAEAFKVCPYWVPPSTFTAVAIAPNASYVRVEYANYVATENVDHGQRWSPSFSLFSAHSHTGHLLVWGCC